MQFKLYTILFLRAISMFLNNMIHLFIIAMELFIEFSLALLELFDQFLDSLIDEMKPFEGMDVILKKFESITKPFKRNYTA